MSITLNDKARHAIDRAQATQNYTEKRNLLGTAIFALKPDAESRMAGAVGFSSLIDKLLLKTGKALEAGVCEAASKVWK